MVKKIQIILIIAVVISLVCYGVKIKKTSVKAGVLTVVLDAGHGGIDAGVIASNGTKESDINLDICYKTKKLLEENCINVVLTRSGVGGLYGVATKGFKNRDMKKRKEIINSSNADLVVSIHVNKCPYEYRKGAQVFYKLGNEESKGLAQNMQYALNKLPNADKDNCFLPGDYFVLNCSLIPSVLVECGFFSNPQNEAQLLGEDYRKKIAFTLSSQITNFLLLKNAQK